jgi:O-antigen ligase
VTAAVIGSLLALAGVRSESHPALWGVAALALLLAAARGLELRRLRGRLGPRRIAFHPSGRWLTFDAHPGYDLEAWSFDLAAPAVPRAPLLRVGLAFAGLVAFQFLPMPAGIAAGTLSPRDTARGLSFVLAALALHLGAAVSFAQPEARQRFRRVVAVLGLATAGVALIQLAYGATRIYGLFEPLEPGAQQLLGPFVNRNHFAGYMLLVIPVATGLLAQAQRRLRHRLGPQPNLRRILLGLGSVEGTGFLYALLPPFLCLAGLLASTSRGGLLGLVAGLAVAVVARRRRAWLSLGAWALALLGVALASFGIERVEARFSTAVRERDSRTLVWGDALRRMDGYWVRGSGFNTFAWAMSRAVPFELPVGATPWPADVRRPVAAPTGPWPAFRVPVQAEGIVWYREAHNDYLQVLVEMGIPGLLLALWAAGACLRAAERDPWLTASLAGLLAHEVVDFPLQIPAVAALFVTLAALRSLPERP